VGTKSGAPLFYDYEPAPADVIAKVKKIEAVEELDNFLGTRLLDGR